jgi:dTDP-4-dehydrorhamnose 3,5-epimerase
VVFEPRVFRDDRGFLLVSFNARDFGEAVGGKVTFVQDNHSRSRRGALRGLHYQIKQPQGKLVRVATGRVFDVAVERTRRRAWNAPGDTPAPGQNNPQ